MSLNNMVIEENKNNANGSYVIGRSAAKLGVLALIATFVLSILITNYLSKSPQLESAGEEFIEHKVCQEYFCNHRDKLIDFEYTCPANENYNISDEIPEIKLDYRLPKDLSPYFYEVFIKPYFNVTTAPDHYDGHVAIKFKCLKNTSTIVLHMNQIEIDESTIELKTENGNTISKKFEWHYLAKTQFLVIQFNDFVMTANRNYSISIGFTGFLKNDNYGFYKSFYLDDYGQKRWLIASQMEPTHARKSFICFDEPEMKAIFKIRVVHDPSLHVLSNMPIKSTFQINSNWIQTDFYETVEMSTYLVALVVSDFKCITSQAHPILSKNVSVSVCSRPNALDQLEYAMNNSLRILENFEKFYNIKYPLPKCDHIALPDFAAGAMENFGLITYREARLLFDPKKTSQAAEQAIVEVIAHELAHMWFGDIVSPAWWNDLWLNEGFARYMQYVGTNSVQPKWQMFDQFVNVLFTIQHLDSVVSSHAISVDVNNPDEISEIFDGITYGKGGSVIRMMHYFLGESVFQKGLTNYLNKYQFKNARQDNLWESLQEQALRENKFKDLSLTNVMNTWTKQMGHPVVNVKIINSTHVSLKQKHFLLDQSSIPQPSTYNYEWFIPFSYSIEKLGLNAKANSFNLSNLHEFITWILPNGNKETIIKLSEPMDSNSYFLANLDVSGFYRINYDTDNWIKIAKQLSTNHKMIPTRIRAQLINDVFSLSQANQIDPIKPFEITKYLLNEIEYLPWVAFLSRIDYYIDMLDKTEIYGLFKSYLIELISPIYFKLSWNDSPHDTWLERNLRTKIITLACNLELNDCVRKSRVFFKKWMNSESKSDETPKNYRSVVYCTAIKFGSEKEWTFANEQYDIQTDSNVKRSLQYGMSCIKEPWLILKHLNNQLNDSKVRTQDALFGVRYATCKPYSNEIVWSYVKTNWNTLTKKYPPSTMSSLIADLRTKFNTDESLNDFANFFHNITKKTREVKISIEKIKANIIWLKKTYNPLKIWLNQNQKTKLNEKISYRLPTSLKPYYYDLTLKPYIGEHPSYPNNKSFKFDGNISISFTCLSPTDVIVLHAKDLVIQNDTIRLSTSDRHLVDVDQNWAYDFQREFMIITMSRECVKEQNYTLFMLYTGEISENLSGFYRSSYALSNGTIEFLGVTQFEPTDARRVFPCFDEPAMKSKFKISIIRHKSFSRSFSNMPLIKTENYDKDWETDHFAESVPMSTYLVAFVVSNYKSIKMNSTKHKIEVEVAARSEAIDNNEGNYALSEAADIIDYFADYFQVEYPLSKSTQIAIPDFNAGAMENWGLITYREKYLLFNSAKDSIFNKRLITLVVAHELAHQWFGNLVSPQWWNDLWLNEGFASWVEYLGLNRTNPQWRDLDYFFVHQSSAMVKDSLESSHPINVEVNDPNEINSLFDDITYSKGASIIRMMNSFLTIDTFKMGVTNYLKRYKMSNAAQDNLWSELTNQGHLDSNLDKSLSVKSIMDTWTLQKGYPVVTVERANSNRNRITYKLTQRWFLLNPLSKMAHSKVYSTQKWYIPFTYTSKSILRFDFEAMPFWLLPTQNETMLITNDNDWIIGNIHHTGFFRVNYDLENWNKLIQQLRTNYKLIDPINRAQLIDDSFNLGRAEYLSQTVFLNIISYLSNETDGLPFETAFDGLYFISNMFSNNYTAHNLFKDYFKSLLRNTYSRLGWNTSLNDFSQINLQLKVIRGMCFLGETDCIDNCRIYYEAWKNKKEIIPVAFKQIVMQTVAKYGTESDWIYLYNLAAETNVYRDRVDIVKSLSHTRNYELLRFLLEKVSDENLIKKQDQTTILIHISRNTIGSELIVDYIFQNWNQLLLKFNAIPFTLNNLVLECFNGLNSINYLNQLETFVQNETVDLGMTITAFKEAIEKITTNIRWMNKNFDLITNWLLQLRNI